MASCPASPALASSSACLTLAPLSAYSSRPSCCLLLVLCAPMSIVCPLSSCYLIIVSVAPPVSPSLPSFVSLFSLLVSAVLCWSVVFRRVCVYVKCTQPVCLFFPFGVVFLALFYFVIKYPFSPALESSHLSIQSIPDSLVLKVKIIAEIVHVNDCLLLNVYKELPSLILPPRTCLCCLTIKLNGDCKRVSADKTSKCTQQVWSSRGKIDRCCS